MTHKEHAEMLKGSVLGLECEIAILHAENKDLRIEVKVLEKFIADNEIILKSANTDVKEMAQYAKSLRAAIEQAITNLPMGAVLAELTLKQALKG